MSMSCDAIPGELFGLYGHKVAVVAFLPLTYTRTKPVVEMEIEALSGSLLIGKML